MKSATLPHEFAGRRFASTLALFALCSASAHCGSDDFAPAAAGTSGASGASGTDASAGASGAVGSAGEGAGGSAGNSNFDSGSDASEAGGTTGNPDAGDAAEDVVVDTTVRGTLRTTRGRPLEGATVLLGESTVVSDARGEFTVENAPATYDLLVLPNPASTQRQVYVYIGLSSRRPIASIGVDDPFIRTTVNGTLSPGYPQPASQRTGIGFRSVNHDASASLILGGDAGPNFGPLNVAWTVGTVVTGRLFALQWSVGANQFPTGYRGWVTEPFSLNSGMPASIDLVLSTLSQREVSGVARFPPGILALNSRLDVESIRVFDNDVQFSPGATSVSYAYPIPIGVGSAARILSFRATLDATGAAATEVYAKLNDTSSTIDFDLPVAPSHALPIDMATAVDGNTEFAWTAVPNAIYRLGVVSTTTATGYAIHTASTNAKIPDLTSKGIPWATGTHLWAVQAVGPADSVDALVTGMPILEDGGRELSASSTFRRFTTIAQ